MSSRDCQLTFDRYSWMTKMTSALCWLSWRPFFINWLFSGADWLSSFVYLLGYHSGRCQARGPQVSAGIPRPLRVVIEVELGCAHMALGFFQFVM